MDYLSNLPSFALLAATIGVLCISVPMLVMIGPRLQITAPLITFLIASGFANALPLFIALYPSLELYSLGIVLILYMLIPCSLWLYVAAITSPTPWQLELKLLWHLIPAGAAMLVAGCLFALPTPELRLLFGQDNAQLGWWPELLVIIVFAMMVLWVFLSAAYVFCIIVRLMRFRASLKDLFANNEQLELYWINWAVCALIATCGLSLFYSVPLLTNETPMLPVELIAGAHLVLIWTFSLFGIQQKPGFEGRYLTTQKEHVEAIRRPKDKYQKSGLNDEALTRIADKLVEAMQDRKLYLDSTLSLQKLSAELHISTNYLSQTLNKKLEKSFFDFINGWRIRHAIPEVLAADKSILDIAMDAGFNARSSFYKAFKTETNCSPSEYKKLKAIPTAHF